MMMNAMFQKKVWEEQEYECWMNWVKVFAEVRTGMHHRLLYSDAVDLSAKRWRWITKRDGQKVNTNEDTLHHLNPSCLPAPLFPYITPCLRSVYPLTLLRSRLYPLTRQPYLFVWCSHHLDSFTNFRSLIIFHSSL